MGVFSFNTILATSSEAACDSSWGDAHAASSSMMADPESSSYKSPMRRGALPSILLTALVALALLDRLSRWWRERGSGSRWTTLRLRVRGTGLMGGAVAATVSISKLSVLPRRWLRARRTMAYAAMTVKVSMMAQLSSGLLDPAQAHGSVASCVVVSFVHRCRTDRIGRRRKMATTALHKCSCENLSDPHRRGGVEEDAWSNWIGDDEKGNVSDATIMMLVHARAVCVVACVV
ncbi:hypothetical protein B0T26DRAFT_782402 [Lasiosphaeria miniovina]|uniref:Uncharacterized protein n=1 Tax=Lasiosphaeria miniovina TaxID=1954250 RepID=A0AA40ACZ0_9PEZI|nr:uncharacterized protein B0T26DRAFT_782402 [Lasiosphaeria miniovina]KAK0713470.1 hypothetical protein B0T26DRAFT_782402 [Lasiosphaeria miniovina]